eukprot:gene25754-31104_t
MGGSASKHTAAKNAPQLRKQENDIVNLMFPVYYTDEELTDGELDLASKAWKMILTCTAPEFAALKAADPVNFDFNHSMVYFYSKFYERLFEVHPLARPLFKDMSSQGKFLVKMLSLALSEKADPDKYRNTLVKLAEIHNDRGIKAVEYGIVGEVLFWSIRACVGVGVYTPELHVAWTKVYSRMLKIMVPIAVAYELKDGKAQEKRFFAHNNNFGMSAEEEMVMNTMAQQADNNQSVTVKKAGTFVAPTSSTSMHQPDTLRGEFTPVSPV